MEKIAAFLNATPVQYLATVGRAETAAASRKMPMR